MTGCRDEQEYGLRLVKKGTCLDETPAPKISGVFE